jgi:rare lipoprotein A
MASHYAERFAGRKTASGAVYRPEAMTAAHRTLPMGTRLKVTRIDKLGHDVAGPIIVVVNDRGPYANNRIIDLSSEAARRLGLYGTIGRVRIEVLDDSDAPAVPPPTAAQK